MGGKRGASVLMTADTIGGVWTYAVELALALSRRGVRVALATMGGPLRQDQRAPLAGAQGITLHESTFRLEWMPAPWEDVARAGRWLLALERQLQPDVVHLNQFAFGALPFRAPALVVAHSCVLSWWRAVHGTAAPAEWARYRAVVQQGLAGAALVAAPTRAMLEALTVHYGLARAGRVLPNARDAAQFRPGVKRPAILAAGRLWDPAKNLAALEAVAPVLPWPVRVAGSRIGPDGREVAVQGVECLGELAAPALAQEMGQAAIYALPARYEPFGLSALEAALAGCALVLGDIASLREVWHDAALYVPPDDTPALRAALERLIASPGERERLAAAARERALSFSPPRMAQAYLQAYGELQPRLRAAITEEAACA